MCHDGLTDTTYEDVHFQRVILEGMGELLPPQLLSVCDLSMRNPFWRSDLERVHGCEQ